MDWVKENCGPVLAFGALTLASAAIWIWVLQGGFGACVVGSTDDALQKTVAALDSTVDLGIKLSVALVGAAGAILLGLKSGLTLTTWTRALLLIAAVLFGQSAGVGVYWKLKVANSWLNRCLNLIYEPLIERAFDAVLMFFVLGLVCALVLIFVAAWGSGNGKAGVVG